MSTDPKNFDTRLIRHQIRRQALTPKQLAEHLASLPDDAAHAVETDARFESSRRSDR